MKKYSYFDTPSYSQRYNWKYSALYEAGSLNKPKPTCNCTNICVVFVCVNRDLKGQLISKGNFGVLNFFKKRTENFTFCPRLLEQKFFVRVLEELKKSISPFGIN